MANARPAPLRRIRLVLVPLAALALGALAAAVPAVVRQAEAAPPAAPLAVPPPGERWREVDRLVEEQKLKEALELASRVREAAQQKGDEPEWARGLIRETQLRMALHGYETAVRFLREQPWPADPLPHALLDLFYAHSLVAYQQVYGWEIAQREEVASTSVPDLKAWTREQIYGEAQKAFLSAWAQRAAWGTTPVTAVSEFVSPSSYPAQVRGTLRDAVSYLFAGLLADSSFWEPRASHEVYRLPLEALIAGAAPEPAAAAAVLADPAAHPLAKLAALLGDLERWHRAAGRDEAAFEARRQRLEHLFAHFTRREDRLRLRAALETALAELGEALPWWSMGMETLAQWTRQDGEDPQALVRARALAERAAAKHPGSIGGQRARHVAAELASPAFSLAAMVTDGPGRRSIVVEHRNLPRLWFRAWRLDLDEVMAGARDYNLLPAWQEVPGILDGRAPDAEWSVELPPTPDLRVHRTHVTPPLEELGLWVIVGSAEEGFGRSEPKVNRLAAVDLVVTELALLAESVDEGFDVRVLAGESGRPVAGADVELWRLDWNRGHRRVRTARTDGAGRASLRWRSDDVPHFLVARHGSDVVLDPNHLWPQRRQSEVASESTLVYTDRSVYRPGQQLHWKAVAYAGRGGGFRTLPGASLDVELVDANGQVVEKSAARTNDFGSAAGSFTVPVGRLLGAWHVRSSRGGAAAVRVEEYKRPTFEVTLIEPEAALRLNHPATLRGEARYYFGLPVTAGSVRWTVSRQPVFPWWWGWWWGGAPPQPQVVAAGVSPLRDDGTFEVRFTPEADEREAETPGMSYRYALSAEATDEGGETRTADRVFRLGFVAVEARIDPEAGFLVAGEPARVTVRRSDLDGAPRPGEGAWRLLRLVEPPRTLLPADQPLPTDPRGGERYRTPGDALRPRWETDSNADAVLREWADGAELASGASRHGEDGEAELELPALEPGAYRLRYTTRDPYGASFETSRELVVAADGARPVALPALLRVERPSVPVGGTARILVSSGLPEQELALDIVRRDRPVERRRLDSSAGAAVIELPIGEAERGGIAVRLVAVRDHQSMLAQEQVLVPWDDKRLRVELATFRDRLRPGTRETWRVTVRSADEKALAAGAAELLAYMYDRSLDLFAPHQPVDPVALYPGPPSAQPLQSSLRGNGEVWSEGSLGELPGYPHLTPARLIFLESWGIGGPGLRHRLFARRGEAMAAGVAGGVVGGIPAPPPPPAPAAQAANEMEGDMSALAESRDGRVLTDRINVGGNETGQKSAAPGEPVELRSEFAETAFWYPQLLTGPDGSVSFEFTTPDSVTEWNVWVHALTADLRAGSLRKQTRTVKELMVRPYLPRFLREGDEAVVQVAVNNAGETPLAGTLRFEILDPESVDTGSERSLLAEFGLAEAQATARFAVEPGKGTTVGFRIAAPPRVGPVAFRVTARAGGWSDGELRPIPVLPGRMHLVQSRFATLRDRERRVLRLPDLAAAAADPTLIHDQLVVTLDGQLLNTVLEALPYLVDYPYECTEQTLNRFLSTGIVSEVFEDHPPLARLGRELAQRETPLVPWALDDPNRRMELEETPWLVAARGGDAGDRPVLRVLDPKVARAQRDAALAKLRKAQTANGAFPWWPGGPPSPFMTLYMLAGFSRALEFGVDVPQDVVERAWGYMHQHYLDEIVDDMVEDDCCWELVTFLDFVLSSYPDAAGSGSESWTGGVFTAAERRQMLDFSFRHWKQHSPLSKGHLALTLQRMGRKADAKLVWDSVMDSARTTEDEGTHWAPEDRAWLWYNDTTETHAFALRVLSELQPDDARRHGLVQWLLLDKKLNHWKSTRATAEVLYSLVHYLEEEGALGVDEEARVTVGDRRRTFRFPADRIGPIVEGRTPGEEARGRANQLVVPGPEVDPTTMAEVVVEKETPGFLFASTTWHFSTEKLPEEARGDLFAVTRTIYRRVQAGDRWQLQPLAEGAPLRPGDQLEVHLSIRSRHAAEYVHLRDPRPAGTEPESLRSGWKWEILPLYEEVRDSGANFFFEWLPAGEYTFKHRLRVAHAGTFRVAPATLQSMYAPEFAAYSAGNVVRVLPAERGEEATRR